MKEIALKYGLNPHQIPAGLSVEGGALPLGILGGKPGYINFMDALNAWQLVKELRQATGLPSAASFKHVSPAGVGVGLPLPETLRRAYFVDDLDLSPIASAYARARGTDRVSSYGDWVALSDACDIETAKLLVREVSDGIIAPAYAPEALEILKGKRGGKYNILQIDPDFVPVETVEKRHLFGHTLEQGRNTLPITRDMLQNVVTQADNLSESVILDMLIAQITLKYTQSNAVCYAKDGQTVGIGAGQQSRIHCTRLAGDKTNNWRLRQHPKILDLKFRDTIPRPARDNVIDLLLSDEWEDLLIDGVWREAFDLWPDQITPEERTEWLKALRGVTVGSDAFFPFGDNVERARKSGADYIIQPGGSVRDDHVIGACDKYGITMVFTGTRLFHH